MRQIRFTEENSGLQSTCDLLDSKAPSSAEFLWQLAKAKPSIEAMHAIWTGPELSCPLPAGILPEKLGQMVVPQENATSFPEPGEVVLAHIPNGSVKGLPPGNFFDIGIFYGPGGRLLMPFGWIKANVCARIMDADMKNARSCIETIRRNGVCRLSIHPVE